MNRSRYMYGAIALFCFLVAGAVTGLWMFLLAMPDHVFTVPRPIAVLSMVLGGPCLVIGIMAFVRTLRENSHRTKPSGTVR